MQVKFEVREGNAERISKILDEFYSVYDFKDFLGDTLPFTVIIKSVVKMGLDIKYEKEYPQNITTTSDYITFDLEGVNRMICDQVDLIYEGQEFTFYANKSKHLKLLESLYNAYTKDRVDTLLDQWEFDFLCKVGVV